MSQFSNAKLEARGVDQELREANSQELRSRLEEEQKVLVEQFKTLRERGAPKQVVMATLGLTEDAYSKLSAREEVKSAVLKAEMARAETNQTFDSNWDLVEHRALTAVAQELAVNPDPDFALRAAAVANKAVRRRNEEAKLMNQTQLAYQQGGVTNIAILELPKVFMNQLKTETVEQAKRQLELQRNAVSIQKFTDLADVQTVKESFGLGLSSREGLPEPKGYHRDSRTDAGEVGGLTNRLGQKFDSLTATVGAKDREAKTKGSTDAVSNSYDPLDEICSALLES